MDYLWSPWRKEYIMQNETPPGCIFCTALEKEDGAENLIVARGERAFVIMNRFPYTSGHIMVVPIEHQPSFEKVDALTRVELMELITRAMGVLRELYHPDGFNVGANIGAAAGAGIADHTHFHIVPRWGGDTSFMSTLAGTRVLPESLEDTYQRLVQAWKSR